MNNDKLLDISWGSVFKVFILIVSVYIIFQIKHILVWFIFALIIAILAEPALDFSKKIRIPRALAVFLIYVGILGGFALIIYLTAPIFISETQQFSRFLPQYLEDISPTLRNLGVEALEDFEGFVSLTRGTLEKITSNLLTILVAIFGGFFAFIFILSTAIFISLEEKSIEKTLLLLFPKKYENYLLSLWKRVQKKVTGWFTAMVLGCIFVGLVTYIALLIFRAPYPFSFGLLAGIFNFVPIIGPTIIGLLLFVIVASTELFKAIFIVIVLIVIQQIEGSIVTPLLSKKFIGISPVLVLFSLAVGGILWGFLGAILAVPFAAILLEFFGDYIKKRKEEDRDINILE